jgi:hypothetical protein
MSFRDVGRKFGDVLKQESSSIAKHPQRKAPPTLRHFQRAPQNQGELARGNQVEEDFSKSMPSRGVRPRLNNVVCPVTEKPLIQMDSTRDEENSTDSSFSYGFDEPEDDDSFPAPVSSPAPRHSDSIFASINKEIVNFQVSPT